MIYNLGVYNKTGKTNDIINLSNLFDINNKESLKQLDDFTSEFESQEELILYLIENRLINFNCKKLDIVYTYSKENKRLPVVYKEQFKYLDTYYVQNKMLSLSNDINFLNKLARHYSIGNSKFNPQGENINAIFNYLNDVRSNGGHIFESRALNLAINDLIAKASFRLNEKTGELTNNYRGLRDLGLFIYRYEQEKYLKNKKEQILESNQVTFDEHLENMSYTEKKFEEITRYSNIADSDEYPGDLEKWNTNGYIEEEENYHI